jgi:thiol-disulfide isomerase/thioredoxin
MKSPLRPRLLTGIGLAVLVLAGSVRSSARSSADITTAGLRKAAPNVSLTDSRGVSTKLSDYRGRVVLLDFWATWCTGCKVEIPWYIEFQKKYVNKGLTSIGVAMDDDGWAAVRPYLVQHPIDYPIVLGNEDFAKRFGVANLPVTLLIDRNGKIADSHLGIVDKARWEREIRQLLEEPVK